MPTVSEVAAACGVSAQTVRRFVKNELGKKTEPRTRIELTINEAQLIADHFAKRGSSVANSVASSDQGKLDAVVSRCNELLQQVATLNERVAGLQRENELLKERLKYADAALEREQMQSRGFWSRLGQRLLGDGKRNDDRME